MRVRFLLSRHCARGEIYYVHNNESGAQESLRTKDRVEAERPFNAKNVAHRQPIINLQIARGYLMIIDPEAATRTWPDVMDEIVKLTAKQHTGHTRGRQRLSFPLWKFTNAKRKTAKA